MDLHLFATRKVLFFSQPQRLADKDRLAASLCGLELLTKPENFEATQAAHTAAGPVEEHILKSHLYVKRQ